MEETKPREFLPMTNREVGVDRPVQVEVELLETEYGCVLSGLKGQHESR